MIGVPADIGEAAALGRRRLADAGIESAALDADLLLATTLGLERERLVLERDRRLKAGDIYTYTGLLARRAQREPLAHLTGRREFYSLDFTVSADALIPRPDSETLIAAALGHLDPAEQAWRILDLGTGSGCLLLSLLHALPDAQGVGTDVSPAALDVARRNAAALGLSDRAEFLEGDWTAPVADEPGAARFDLVICNPPYIPSGELAGLMPEVSTFEPQIALDGGADGLDAYRRLAREVPRVAASGGLVILELGADQAGPVQELLAAQGLDVLETHADLEGRARALCARHGG